MDKIEGIYRKIKVYLHILFHFWVYYKAEGVVLYGVPKLIYGSRINFGKQNRINEGVVLHAANRIYLGSSVTLSANAMLITESYDVKDWGNYLKRKHSGKPIFVGNNVWIGAGAVILPGVKIANNIVVGAGSIVTHDLNEEGCVYAGNPAKRIKMIGEAL
ncbi:MAG: acyltransferase [Lachnospiraceae bacterium]|nr:acyltransferase [Lachnospiraceae bacterium]